MTHTTQNLSAEPTSLVEAFREMATLAQDHAASEAWMYKFSDLIAEKLTRPDQSLIASLTLTTDDPSLAEIGEEVIKRTSENMWHPALVGWSPTDCPSEIICHLLNEYDELAGIILKGQGK